MTIKSVAEAIHNHQHFLISSHVNPDPDALCSEIALALTLKSLGKNVTIVSDDVVPQRLKFLPGSDAVVPVADVKNLNYDVMIVLDCGDIDRIGKVKSIIHSKKILINIDHHITNTKFGNINFVKPKASSTCEVLHGLFEHLQVQWTDTIALHIYAGIMTDTGSFRFENTTSNTHRIAAFLRKFDFSADELYRNLYESIPLSDLQAFTEVVSSFKSLSHGQIVVMELTEAMFKRFSSDFDLRDAIFKFLRSIKDTEVLVILTEAKDVTRINFRSSGRIDVANLASAFGGGGHHNASGCTIAASMSEAKERVLTKIKNLL